MPPNVWISAMVKLIFIEICNVIWRLYPVTLEKNNQPNLYCTARKETFLAC